MIIPQLRAVEVHGMTRSAFILRGVLAAGALYGSAAAAPVVRSAFAQGAGDVDILNFALTLEYLEADFYRVASELTLPEELAEIAVSFGEDEQAHVDALANTIRELGGRPVERPRFAFPLQGEEDFVRLATELEDTGVSAYNGAAPQIESKDVLAAAGSIVQVEARHAGALRLRTDQPPAPDAFDPALDMSEVLEAVRPFMPS